MIVSTEINMLIVLGAAAHYFLILVKGVKVDKATSKLHRYASTVLKFNSSEN